MVWLWILGSREVSVWLATFGVARFSPGTAATGLEGNPLDRNLYLALLALGVIVLVKRRQQVARLLRANMPAVLFFSYCAVSILWSDYPGVSFKRWIKALGDPVMVLVVLTDPNRAAAVRRLLARVGYLLVPLSVLVIKYFPSLAVWYSEAEGKQVISGVAADKNALGTICMLCGLAFHWRALAAWRDRGSSDRVRHLLVQGTLLAMVIWLLSKANSMTSLVCFVLAAGLMMATSFPAVVRKRAALSFLVAAILTVATLPMFLTGATGLLDTIGRDATFTGRAQIWRDALAVDNDPVVGAGFESFWLGASLDEGRSFHVNEAHNGYLEVYLNLGWVGVFLLGVVVIRGYQNVLATLRMNLDEGRLGLAYWVAALVYSLTEAGFRMMNVVWICFLLAVFSAPEAFISRVPSTGSRSAKGRSAPVAGPSWIAR